MRPWAVGLGLAAALLCGAPAHADPLPSWRDRPAKQRILAFVASVTEPGGAAYVAPPDRIATFDNDGCLWVEKPTYTQVFFVLDRLRALAPSHPEWKTASPYREALAGDLASLGVLELMKLLAATHAGMTQAEFEAQAAAFFASAKHPRWKRPFQDLVYQPQLELLEHLRANDFRVFIVTGGGRDFVREISEETYGIPRDRVVGSALQTRFELGEDGPRLRRLPQIAEPINDKAGKPVNIERHIGRRPILAVGNSDGDIQMLQWAAGGPGATLSVLVHHDDAEREYAYTHGTEKALELAASDGWVLASMKDDWKAIFPQ